MKKLIFFSLFTFIFSLNSKAQSGLGIKGGLTFNRVFTDAGSFKNNIQQSLDTRTGYVVGLFGRLGNKIYLQPELLVANKGGSIDVITTSGGTQKIDFNYTNLDVPLLLGFKPVKFLRVMAGPVATVNLSSDQRLRDALRDYASNIDDTFKQATFGYQVGVGVKLLGLEIDLRKDRNEDNLKIM
ncbi:MAG: PorT family protein [Spirosomaceae bacterium]|nr:PorT family protein [Spirosomataceae bacterium]